MITLKQIEEAQQRIYKMARKTSLKHSSSLSKITGYDVFLKPECLQKTGSFKIRGAANKILTLSAEEGASGVVTGSSGNHGQAVACAAALAGFPATVIMPEGGSQAKAESIRGYGAELLFCGTTSDARLDLARKLREERGMVLVHPYDDPHVMAGQGTIGLEILDELADVDAVLVSTGGCGLISGIATAIKERNPKVKVFGIEPKGSNSTTLSFRAGKRTRLDEVSTVADGIRTSIPGELTFPVVQKYVDDMFLVSEEDIFAAVKLILQRCKLLPEPTGAVALAALLGDTLPVSLRGKRIVPILSGGNVALDQVAKIIG